eukprot:7388951-Prymnesium_polylepis.2
MQLERELDQGDARRVRHAAAGAGVVRDHLDARVVSLQRLEQRAHRVRLAGAALAHQKEWRVAHQRDRLVERRPQPHLRQHELLEAQELDVSAQQRRVHVRPLDCELEPLARPHGRAREERRAMPVVLDRAVPLALDPLAHPAPADRLLDDQRGLVDRVRLRTRLEAAQH